MMINQMHLTVSFTREKCIKGPEEKVAQWRMFKWRQEIDQLFHSWGRVSQLNCWCTDSFSSLVLWANEDDAFNSDKVDFKMTIKRPEIRPHFNMAHF